MKRRHGTQRKTYQRNLYLGFVKADQYIEQIEIRKLRLCNTMGPVMNNILHNYASNRISAWGFSIDDSTVLRCC